MDAKLLAQLTAEVIKSEVEAVEKRFAAELLAIKENIDNIPKQDISHLEQRINDAIAAIPEVKDGEPGADGKDGETPQAPTADEVAKSMEGLFSTWALGFERNAVRVLEKAIDNMPTPKDGKDAFALEDFDLSLSDDGRTLKMAFSGNGNEIEKSIKLATILDKGVFKDGAKYEKGDAVTFGGSAYVAQKDLPIGKPGATNDWRLFAKRGRDGKPVAKTKELPKTYKVDGKSNAN